jgi:hypothetical protein
MQNYLKKLLCGNRQTYRIKDAKGNLVQLSRLLRNSPRAAATCIGRKLFNFRPETPWVSYDAVQDFERFLPRTAVILEFGSGMSTIWYARHSREVFSVEDNPAWFKLVGRLLKARQLANVHYHLHQGPAYCLFPEAASLRFDFVMVDGTNRLECVKFGLEHLNSDAMLYLDNSDDKDHSDAEIILLEEIEKRRGRCIYFTDFAPTALWVNQGMLALFGRYTSSI